MLSKKKRIGLRVVSAFMLFFAFVMPLFCVLSIGLNQVHYHDMGYRDILPLGTVSCIAAAILYLFSAATAILGLVHAGKPRARHGVCRVFAYIQLITCGALIFTLFHIWLFIMPPLALFTILYLVMIGWRRVPEVPENI